MTDMAKRSNAKTWIKNPFIQKGFWTVLAFLALICVWAIACAIVGNAYLLPSLGETVKAGVLAFGRASFWTAFLGTLGRALCAFFISFALAAALAAFAYAFEGVRKFFAPVVSFFRSLPTMAVLLLILLWTSAKIAPIVIACLVLFPMLYAAMIAALCGVDEGLLEMSRVYFVPKKVQICKLYIPDVAPTVCKEGAAALAFSLKLVVSAEVMSNTFQSLGGEMQNASLYDKIPLLFALVCVTFLTGYALECIGLAFARAVERRVL